MIKINKQFQKIIITLESLTPGGNQYINNPFECIKFIKYKLNKADEILKENIRLKKLIQGLSVDIDRRRKVI